jgi:hypothetical protein
LEPDRAILRCLVVEPVRWCRRCGCQGAARDTVVRRLAHEPFGWRPTVLEVSLRRYRCNAASDDRNTDRRRAASRQSPTLPSIISRRMSAWPACRPVSRITCRYTHRNVSSLPRGA